MSHLLDTDFRKKMEKVDFDLSCRVDVLLMVCRFAPRLEPTLVRFAKVADFGRCRICADSLDDLGEIVGWRLWLVEPEVEKTGQEQDIDAAIAAVLLLL